MPPWHHCCSGTSIVTQMHMTWGGGGEFMDSVSRRIVRRSNTAIVPPQDGEKRGWVWWTAQKGLDSGVFVMLPIGPTPSQSAPFQGKLTEMPARNTVGLKPTSRSRPSLDIFDVLTAHTPGCRSGHHPFVSMMAMWATGVFCYQGPHRQSLIGVAERRGTSSSAAIVDARAHKEEVPCCLNS